MRSFLSFSKAATKAKKLTWPLLGLAAMTAFLVSTSRQVYSPIVRKVSVMADKTVVQRVPEKWFNQGYGLKKPD